MSSPHDALFKAVFGNAATAAAHLAHALPAAVAARLDLASLAPRPGTFIDAELGDRHADLVFEAALRGSDRSALVYLLFEHQSTSDALMPLRLLRYMLRLWDQCVADEPARRSLPPIVPVVLHQGENGWTSARQFLDLFDLDAATLGVLAPFLPGFDFVLNDLASIPDQQLRGAALGQVALLLMKHHRKGDLADKLRSWTDLLSQVASQETTGLRGLQLVVEYLLRTADIDVADLANLIQDVHPDMQHIIETTADRLRTEGRAEGRTEGRAEGRLVGQAEAVVRVLEARSVELSDSVRRRILDCRDAAELDRWLRRASVISAITDLFAPEE